MTSLFDTSQEWTPKTSHEYDLRFAYKTLDVEAKTLLQQALINLMEKRIQSFALATPPNYKESFDAVLGLRNKLNANVQRRKKLAGDYARYTIQPLELVNEYENVLNALTELLKDLVRRLPVDIIQKSMNSLIEELKKSTNYAISVAPMSA